MFDSDGSSLVPTAAEAPPTGNLAPRVEFDFRQVARADNTTRAYESDWRRFTDWCATNEVSALPASPQTIIQYLTARALGRWPVCGDPAKLSTIVRSLASINFFHVRGGYEPPRRHPDIAETMKGMRRSSIAVTRRVKPLLVSQLRTVIASTPRDLAGLRDRALLLLGFAACLRRSELVALRIEDVERTDPGLVVQIRRSKTDQEQRGDVVAVCPGQFDETCPVLALRAWIDAAGILEGFIFRRVDRHGRVLPGRLSAHAVANIVKRAVTAAKIEPDEFSGHSLRAGFATSAAANGCSANSIRRQGRWRSAVFETYIRHGSVFDDNASSGIGL